MDATLILHPDARCVRSKMSLFVRLWIARYRYEQQRPFGGTPAECLQFHLQQLGECWERVVHFQKAIGLEVIPFAPREQFETIYLVSGYVQREFESADNCIIEGMDIWQEYARLLGMLSHQLNPFDFGEKCTQCSALIRRLAKTGEPQEKIIPLRPHPLEPDDERTVAFL